MSPVQRLAAADQLVAQAVDTLCRCDNEMTAGRAAYLITRAGMLHLRTHRGHHAAETMYQLADECVGADS